MRSVFLRSMSAISAQLEMRETVPSRPMTMGPRRSSATAVPLISTTVLPSSPLGAGSAGKAGKAPTVPVAGDAEVSASDAAAGTSSSTVGSSRSWAAGAGASAWCCWAPAGYAVDDELPGPGDVLAAEAAVASVAVLRAGIIICC